MPTIGSVTKTVRIAPRDLEVIEGLMADGTSWSGAIHKLCSENRGEKMGTPSKNSKNSGLAPNKDLEEIDSMAKFFGMNGVDLLKGVCDGLMDGNLTVENGKVVGVPEIDLVNLKEACHERGIGMQEAIDKTVKNLRSGK